VIPCSNAFITASRSEIREVYLKLELYKNDGTFLKEITKKVVNDIGSISVNATSPIRRTFSFTLDNSKNDFDWGENNLIWINKRMRLYIGLKLADGTVEYVPQGVFVLTEPQDSHTLDGKKVNITGQDLMSLLTDKRGKFITDTNIASGLNIGTAIKTIAQGVGITQFNFDTTTQTVPYSLSYQAGDNRYKAIEELALLGRCDVYFDVFGYLRLRNIDLNEFDSLPIVWNFSYGDSNEKFYAGNVRKMDETDLANHIRVLGGSGQTATILYDLVVDNTNSLWTNSPYAIQEIGRIVYFHNNNNPDPLITSSDAAKWRAKYELMKRLGYSEHLSLNISPIYLFDANDVIQIEDGVVTGKYLIQSFSLPINPQLMTCECLKYRSVISDWNFI
jgi:hypothetical protein